MKSINISNKSLFLFIVDKEEKGFFSLWLQHDFRSSAEESFIAREENRLQKKDQS